MQVAHVFAKDLKQHGLTELLIVLPFMALLANPQASSSLITEFLYTGPRLVLGAWQLVRQARRLARVDRTSCAWVLEVLMGSSQAMTYEELESAWPEADWQKVCADIASIHGVVILKKGLSLTGEFREELLRVSNAQIA